MSRRKVMITYKGKTQGIDEWALEFGLNKRTFRHRYYSKIPMEIIEHKSLKSNCGRKHKLMKYKGKSQTSEEWASEFGINHRTFLSRLRYGWTMEEIENTPVAKRSKRTDEKIK